MKRFLLSIAALLLFTSAAFAQVPSSQPTYMAPKGPLTVFTLLSQGAASLSTTDIVNFGGKGVSCYYNQSAISGTPSTVMSILEKDYASGVYISAISDAAVTTAINTPSKLSIFPGAPVTSNVSANAYLSRTYRISLTVAGSATPIVTGTVGCQSIW